MSGSSLPLKITIFKSELIASYENFIRSLSQLHWNIWYGLCLSCIHIHCLRKHHEGGDVRNLHALCLSHIKLGWGELHTEFYTACTWYTCCSLLGWRSIAWLKNESKFCHINSLQEVAVFSYWTASSCVAALVPLSRKQFNAYCLLFCVTLQDKKKI